MSSKIIPDDHQSPKIEVERGEKMMYTGLSVFDLNADETLSAMVGPDEEVCIVFIRGYGDVNLNGIYYDKLGNRMSPFVEQPPVALYVKANDHYEITALTPMEIAICMGKGSGLVESRIIDPLDMPLEHRGQGAMQRLVKNILSEYDEAESLLVVEVITDGGNWSSFPPHRHDTLDLPYQSLLEEIYYHKIQPNEGVFALQRIYNDSRSLDATYTVEEGTTILVKEGYHPVSVPPGARLYYLNVMAGPKRTWKFHTDPNFLHLLE